MGLLRLAAVGAVGYAVYNWFRREEHSGRVAFASGETDGDNFAKVRNAGPDAMRSDPPEWDRADEASDESFPASDPPATY
jgi:hypothetical protein